MRLSRLFGQTLRGAPAEALVSSHQFLLRAGFIRPLAPGIFSYLPLARRSLARIEAILREEMDAIGGQEIEMPVVHPAEIWKESGRWYEIGPEMGRFQDRAGREMVLSMAHEEVIADLVRREVRSCRQLPLLLYHIQTQWRDALRPRAGLIRAREFIMLGSYSLDADPAGLDAQYRAHYQAYFNIFRRCALPVIAVRSNAGRIGGSMAHEFMYLTPIGEDTILLCDGCGYTANRQVARFRKPPVPEETPCPMEKVATPGTTTIEDLAAFLDIPRSRTAKAVFIVATLGEGEREVERFVFAVVRGDMEVNEAKLANVLRARALRPAREEEIRTIGAEPGYGSPVGVRGAYVVVDDAIPESPNLVAGANEPGYHLRNVNYGRDFRADLVADIAAADEGCACPDCGRPMRASRGVGVGKILKVGTRYWGCTFLDAEGHPRPVVMGSYGMDLGRLLACIAEEHHDEYGLIWPCTVAPYPVHLLALGGAGTEPAALAERLYGELGGVGIEVLYDDREESPGVKFMDADLIGLPLRLTVSRRSLGQGGAEFKRRDRKERFIVPLEQVIPQVKAVLSDLEAEIARGVVKVPFGE